MVRLDVWLDVACVFKTRSEAQRACKGGKVVVNGHRGKPHREIHVGDEIEITRSGAHNRRIVVTTVADAHLPKAQARSLYDDVTPPPPPQEAELREILRRAGPVPGARNHHQPSPDRRARRALRRLKGAD